MPNHSMKEAATKAMKKSDVKAMKKAAIKAGVKQVLKVKNYLQGICVLLPVVGG